MTALDRYIPSWDRHLDAIVLTHPHDDHVAGLVAVVQRYRVGRAFESGRAATTPTYEAWKAALASNGLRPERLATGQTVHLDGASLEVLWPDDANARPNGLDPNATDNRKTNDSSIVLLGEYEGRRFLLTGDIEDDVDPILLERGLGAADMLKVAHHGSGTASSDDLLAAVHPSVAVVSVGADNTYGHPNAATMGRLRAHSGSVLRTDQAGTVETTLDRTAVTVTSSRREGGGQGATTGAAAGATAVTLTGAEAAAHAATDGPSCLLYDAVDVRTRPSRQRGTSTVTGSACLAPPPLTGSRGNGRMAGVACEVGRTIARPPPG